MKLTLVFVVDRFEDKPYCLDHCAVAYVVPEKEENEKTELNNTI